MADGIHELTAGYALDALDGDERRAYEEHLAGCERCRDDLASFWDVTSALAVAASGPEPSPELRERVLASVRAEPQNVVPLAPRRRGYVLPAVAAVAAVAAAVAIGLGIYALSLSNDLDDARSALSQPPQVVPIEGAEGRLLVQAEGRAWLELSGLPDGPGGEDVRDLGDRGPDAPAGRPVRRARHRRRSCGSNAPSRTARWSR